jgi:glyoxylase-like metal-dependent hydrolase (beta-lactamase superfamily II)
VREELDYDLLDALRRGEARDLRSLATALTPPLMPVRFDTRFYRVELSARPEFRLDSSELLDHGWATPAEWLRRYRSGELLIGAPTRLVLETLATDPQAASVDMAPQPDRSRLKFIESIHGVRQFMVRSSTLPPAAHTNCYLIGDEGAPRLLVDPSPNSREELERLCAAAQTLGFDEVFLSHHHPDHRQFADEIARRYRVPLAMSADTRARIAALQPGFFREVQTRLYREGDVATRWLGRSVRVLEVPGHDEGQLALMPEDRSWCIVGDLIQGVGTVVIAAPEGDMRKYFATLERIIDLAPRAIFPSHGGALGGVHYLQQVLNHRRLREAQIKALYLDGKALAEILAEVYRGVDAFLLPLARMNVESHLAKLRAENQIA